MSAAGVERLYASNRVATHRVRVHVVLVLMQGLPRLPLGALGLCHMLGQQRMAFTGMQHFQGHTIWAVCEQQ